MRWWRPVVGWRVGEGRGKWVMEGRGSWLKLIGMWRVGRAKRNRGEGRFEERRREQRMEGETLGVWSMEEEKLGRLRPIFLCRAAG